MRQLQKNVFLTYFKATILIIMTFCLGYVMATGIARMLDKKEIAEVKVDPENYRDVFVLKNNLGKGSEVSPEDVLVVQQLKNIVPRSAVKTFQQIEGRTIKTELPKGAILTDDYFVAKIANNNPAGYIPPGYHSVTIQVYESDSDLDNSIHLVRPGDQVDILVVKNDPETGEKLDEILLLEKIPVLETVAIAGDTSGSEKRGTVALLLDNSQKKHLQEEVSEETTIRLRICPTNETQTAEGAKTHNQQQVIGFADYSESSDHHRQPDVLSRAFSQNTNGGAMTIEFRNRARDMGNYETANQTVGQVLKPFQQGDLQIPTFRGISAENQVEVATLSHDARLDNAAQNPKLVESRPAPRYSSFYDTTGQSGNADVQWRAVSPHPPVVFEAKPGSQTQARGVYREGGTYFSAE